MQVITNIVGSKGEGYEIRQGKDGKVYCTCWSWRLSKETPKTCKHLQRMVAFSPVVKHGLGAK